MTRAGPTRPKHPKRRALLGLLLCVVALELGLRFAGAALVAVGARGPTSAVGAGDRILCIGDSSTYGLYLAGDEAYPAELGRLIEAHAAAPAQVVNLGIPGQGVHHVLDSLPAQLERYRPSVVIVLAGANNTWPEDEERTSWIGRTFRSMRLVKLATMIARRVGIVSEPEARPRPPAEIAAESLPDEPLPADGRLDLEQLRDRSRRTDEGFVHRIRNRAGEEVVFLQERTALEDADLKSAVARGLEGIVDLCRQAGAQPVLLTYPFSGGSLDLIGEALRDVAQWRGVPLVDLQRIVRPYVAAGGSEMLAFPDLHPRPEGTRLMALAVYRGLVEAGIVAGQDVPLPVPEELVAGFQPAQRAIRREGEALIVEGAHGETVRVLLSTTAGEGRLGQLETGLGPSQLLIVTRADASYSFSIGAEGSVELPLPAGALEACRASGTAIRAAAVFGLPTDPGEYLTVVTAVVFDPAAGE